MIQNRRVLGQIGRDLQSLAIFCLVAGVGASFPINHAVGNGNAGTFLSDQRNRSNEDARLQLAKRFMSRWEAASIKYSDSMLVVSNDEVAFAIAFDPRPLKPQAPLTVQAESSPKSVGYRWTSTDGRKSGQGEIVLGQSPQFLRIEDLVLVVENPVPQKCSIYYHPRRWKVHAAKKDIYEKLQEELDPADPPGRPIIRLSDFQTVDMEIQQKYHKQPYNGQKTEPRYPRTPFPTRIYYRENGLVVSTPRGVSVFSFEDPIEWQEGAERRHGVNYRWRFISADGSKDEAGAGAVWETYTDGKYNSQETRHYLEAGQVHIPWSRGGRDSGWIYFDPAWHLTWWVKPDRAAGFTTNPEDAAVIRSLAFGDRPLSNNAK